jgi:hypothetical protein
LLLWWNAEHIHVTEKKKIHISSPVLLGFVEIFHFRKRTSVPHGSQSHIQIIPLITLRFVSYGFRNVHISSKNTVTDYNSLNRTINAKFGKKVTKLKMAILRI